MMKRKYVSKRKCVIVWLLTICIILANINTSVFLTLALENNTEAGVSICAVRLEANEGKYGERSAIEYRNIEVGTTITEMKDYVEPSRKGYSFEGWYIEKDGTGEKITKIPTDHNFYKVLYAHWKKKEFTVSYDCNASGITLEGKTVTYEELYGELPTPQRDGYIFEGWYTEKENGKRITADTKVETDVAHTLYAHWSPRTFIISLDKNDGIVTPTSISVTYDKTYQKLPIPKKTGYSFLGWYTAEMGGVKITNTTPVKILENQKLYAHWKANNYTVTFDASSGKSSKKNMELIYGQEYGELPTATRKSYLFMGWYTSSGKKVKKSDVYKLTDNQTLKAKWKKVEVDKKFRLKNFRLINGDFQIVTSSVKNIDGYTIYVNTTKDVKTAKKVNIEGNSKNSKYTLSKSVYKFKNGVAYFISIRGYKYDSKHKKVYGKQGTPMVYRYRW